ncbi:hypothetical protein Tco_0008996 [Tanacetum coccineum]
MEMIVILIVLDLWKKLKAMDSKVISLNEELQDMREKYNELRNGNASKNHLKDDMPICERHEANDIQSEGYQNRNSHDSFSHQSLHDPNDSEKSLTELNNDVRNALEDFKRRTYTPYLLDGYGVLGKSSLFFFVGQSIVYGVSLMWIRRILQSQAMVAIDAIPLATKPSMIFEYKIVIEGNYNCWKDYADRDEIKDLSEKRSRLIGEQEYLQSLSS